MEKFLKLCIAYFITKVHLMHNLVKTQTRKQIISYSKTNGIMTLNKHVDVDHVMIPKKFQEEIKNLVKFGYLKDNQQKKT